MTSITPWVYKLVRLLGQGRSNRKNERNETNHSECFIEEGKQTEGVGPYILFYNEPSNME